MAYNSDNRSERLLQGRRATTDNLTLSQEAFTDVFDLGASEIFSDDGLIPSGSTQLAFSGSTQDGLIVSASVVSPSISSDLPILKYHYRKKLKQSADGTREVYYFTTSDPSSLTDTVTSDQLIETDQQTNFVSPKYIIASDSVSSTEANPPGYKVVVYKDTASSAGSISSSPVDASTYVFDFKTGVLAWTSGNAPNSNQYVYITVYQYIGRTLRSQIDDGTIGGGASPFTAAGITGSFSGQTGSFVVNSQTSSFVTNSQTSSFASGSDVSGLLSATSSYVLNSQTTSFAITSSNVLFANITSSGNISSSGTGSFIYVQSTEGARIDGTLRTYTDAEGNSRNVGLHVDQDISASGFVGEFFEISSSIVFSSSSTQFGDNLNDTHQFTGSVFITGSNFSLNGLNVLTTANTSSFVTNSDTSSFASGSDVRALINVTSSYVLNSETASFAITSSNVSFANITSSGDISGSSVSTGSFGHIKIDGTNIKTFISSSVASDGFGAGGGISDIVTDTTPQLGGNLDLNGKEISGSGAINITGNAVINGDVITSGSVIPDGNGVHSLGRKGNKFKSIFAQDTFFGDMNLSNEDREPNEIDGTHGSWTIQEGEEDLFLINRKSGKKYKFMLKEVE